LLENISELCLTDVEKNYCGIPFSIFTSDEKDTLIPMKTTFSLITFKCRWSAQGIILSSEFGRG